MHELAVCQALLEQVTKVALENQAGRVTSVRVLCGPLSGVEPHLLASAFTIARAGTIAATAELSIDAQDIVIHCMKCNADHKVNANRLCCPVCNTPSPHLVSGDALMLAQLEFEREAPRRPEHPEPCNPIPGAQYV